MDEVRGPVAGEFTTKQMGDACEMLVAAELTLAGEPPRRERPQTISVKARAYRVGGSHFVEYSALSVFDWLAVVILHEDDSRAIYVIPCEVADNHAR
jgi:hypothetical protein